MKPNEYAKNPENYLPSEIADFHDQKDLFKTFEEIYAKHEAFERMPNTWVDNHVFTVDFLLYFFALHGYKLQKIRTKKVDFCDLSETLRHYKKQRDERSFKVLKEALGKNSATTPWPPASTYTTNQAPNTSY